MTGGTGLPQVIEPFDARLALRARGLLRTFNEAGVLAAADVQVAARLARFGGIEDERVVLAAALAVRAPRLGHVTLDLATIRATAVVDAEQPVDVQALPWPAVDAWLAALEGGPLMAGEAAPLRLEGSLLYLDRYWAEERRLAADLRELAEAGPDDVDVDVLRDGIVRLFADDAGGRQAVAAATAVLRRLTVVAGGPGTGKTTTVARVVALLAEQARAAGRPLPLVALAAPTGKAATRLEESVQDEGRELAVDDAVCAHTLSLRASTLHRLLGWRPDSATRFRHDRANRLPHDVIIVDESSMVSLTLMTRLVEAVRPEARLILVGDPGQLRSIEAGAVLGDIVGPADERPLFTAAGRARLEAATGHAIAGAGQPPAGAALADGIVVLDRIRRFGGAIAELAAAIRRGDVDAAMDVLRTPHEDVLWIPEDLGATSEAGQEIRTGAVAAARAVRDAATRADAATALRALGSYRLLCAHRRGPHGVATWAARIEEWLAEELEGFDERGRWFVGRPVLVRDNDYEIGLNNGDTGVVVQRDPGRVVVAFERADGTVEVSPSRLGSVETVYAMTIHKSQGSQFETAAVVLPDPTSRILTRELLYTAVTRATSRLVLACTEATIRDAIARPVSRASGLERRLWAGP